MGVLGQPLEREVIDEVAISPGSRRWKKAVPGWKGIHICQGNDDVDEHDQKRVPVSRNRRAAEDVTLFPNATVGKRPFGLAWACGNKGTGRGFYSGSEPSRYAITYTLTETPFFIAFNQAPSTAEQKEARIMYLAS